MRESFILWTPQRITAHAGKNYTVIDSAKNKRGFFAGNQPVSNCAKNERPRGKPRGIKERNPQEHTQQAAGYSSSRESGINRRDKLCGARQQPRRIVPSADG
jgi:hypothetical protein